MKKRFVILGCWIIFVVCLFILLGFIQLEHKSIICRKLNILIKNQDGNCFITKDDVKNLIYQTGNLIEGQPLSKINIKQIENLINENNYVEKVDVYTSIDGTIVIKVIPRNPILRIIDKRDSSYYIDDQGMFMPLSKECAVSVPIANGNIEDVFYPEINLNKEFNAPVQKSILYSLYRLAEFIYSSEFWSAQINQIYVNPNGDIELIPLVGDHIIILGNIENMKEKFRKLYIFYIKGLNHTGWDKYKIINLKYKNQVICTKN